jgi:hypothetical protein
VPLVPVGMPPPRPLLEGVPVPATKAWVVDDIITAGVGASMGSKAGAGAEAEGEATSGCGI